MLIVTIDAAQKIRAIRKSSLDRVIVDTTVMPKAIAHPTDSRLLEKSRQHMVKLADEHEIELRQNYNREAPRLALQVGRYAHAKQYKRMRKTVKALKTRVGRVYREVQRNLDAIPAEKQDQAKDLLYRVNRILTQDRKDKNKLYALHTWTLSVCKEINSDFRTKKLQPYIRIWTHLRSASDFLWLHKLEIAFVYPGSLV